MTDPALPPTPNPLHTMGLIVLRVDETIETEFRHLIPPDAARLYTSRVQSGDDLTPDSIAEMGTHLADAAGLLPSAADFDVVGYACTSGTALLGEDHVAQTLHAHTTTRHVTNPLTAAVAQIKALGLSRVGIVSPYLPEVAKDLSDAFTARGVPVADSITLNIKQEAKVARVSHETLASAAQTLTDRTPLDGVFLSCTNLNTRTLVGPLAEALGLPVLSSNLALAWHMQTLAARA